MGGSITMGKGQRGHFVLDSHYRTLKTHSKSPNIQADIDTLKEEMASVALHLAGEISWGERAS